MVTKSSDEESKHETEVTVAEGNTSASGDDLHLAEGGKKDPFLRRLELLVNSGLAEVCCFTFWILH